MITISLCMIVKNEENVLARCLDSVKDLVDEIIIVDTGSSDSTKEIAARYTPNIYNFNWIDDFSAARNHAFSKATMDYQMWLDADDVLNNDQLEKLKLLKQTLNTDVDIVTIKYNLQYDVSGNPTISSIRERLVKRANNYMWLDPIHEYIPLIGNILNSDIEIEHRKECTNPDPERNLRIYQTLQSKGADFTPRQLYYYSRELKDNAYYEKAIHYFKKFLSTKKGWVEDNITACHQLATCYNVLGHKEKALRSLLASFTYDSPRAEIVCEIAYYYKNQNDYKKAADWFGVALSLNKPQSYCFINHDCYDFIPLIELCVCYYNLGDIQKAKQFHSLAAQLKPENNSIKFNTEFFSATSEDVSR